MKTKLTMLVALAMAFAGCTAQPIYLQDVDAGGLYGPIPAQAGDRIKIDGNELEVVVFSARQRLTLSRLKNDSLGSSEFTNASLSEIVGFLSKRQRRASREDPVLFSLDLEGYSRKVWPTGDPFEEPCTVVTNLPLLSLSINGASLYDHLIIVAAEAKLCVHVSDNEVILSQKSRQDLSNKPAGR